MWQGMGVVGVKMLSSSVLEIEIGGKNERSKRLLGYHSEREKSELTAPSKSELDIISSTVSDRIISIVNRNIS